MQLSEKKKQIKDSVIKEIGKILEPPVDYFAYISLNDANQVLFLCNCPYYKNLNCCIDILKMLKSIKNDIEHTSECLPTPLKYILPDKIGTNISKKSLYNPLILAKYLSSKTINLYVFASSVPDMIAQNYYLNNLEKFKYFIYLIDETLDHNKQVLNEIEIKHNITIDKCAPAVQANQFLNMMKIRRFPLITQEGKEVILTEKQVTLILRLVCGETYEQIAYEMGCKSSTVETNLMRLKLKTGTYSKDGLIKLFLNNLANWL